MTVWFMKSWYEYLLAPKSNKVSWFTAINCRRKGHPHGVTFYRSYGEEPDMTCKICGDNLG